MYYYLVNARKNGQMPALGAGHKRLGAVPQEMLSPAGWAAFERAYAEVV